MSPIKSPHIEAIGKVMYSNNIEVDILVNGRPIKQYAHEGRTYVKAEHWTEYTIKIKNTSWLRKLAVVSVDGINVMNGQAAGSTKAGYLVNGYSTIEIKGFRTSTEAVHPFKFNRKSRSYAAKSEETKGDTRNCGVIGVEIYNEYEEPIKITTTSTWYPQPIIWNTSIYTQPKWGACSGTTTINSSDLLCRSVSSNSLGQARSSHSSQPMVFNCSTSNLGGNLLGSIAPEEHHEMDYAATPKRSFDMGTEFSEREVNDPVHEVEFRLGSLLASFSIYYASKEALTDMEVIPKTYKPQVSFPDPFPSKFCKPPRS